MMIQFFREVPGELDEAVKIGRCNAMQTLCYVIVPLLKPAIVSCALFQFMWTSNDFMRPLIYISDMINIQIPFICECPWMVMFRFSGIVFWQCR